MVLDKVVVAPKVLPRQAQKKRVLVKKPALTANKLAPKSVAKTAAVKSPRGLSGYTIQLLASQNLGKLKRFAELHHLNGKTQVHRALRNGSTWYILTLGDYADHKDAKNAVSHLPKEVAQFKPWIRTVSDLKAQG